MPSIKTSFATVSLFILFVFACVAYVANAEEESLTPQERFKTLEAQTAENREARQATMEEKRAALASTSTARKEEMVERVAVKRVALNERAQERIKNLAANISNRMDAAVLRMNQIIVRLDARIEELDAAGVDTDVAEGHLSDAKAAVERAADAIADIDTQMASVTGSESPKEAWGIARGTFTEVKTELKAAHEALRATVAALKEAVKAVELERGSSAAVRSENAAEVDPASTE